MHTCLDYVIELKADFILFQEFFIINNNITIISYSIFYYIILFIQNIRSKIIIFARK